MKLNDLLESYSMPMIVVDIQPAYHRAAQKIIHDFTEYLNQQTGPILYFYNGEDMSLDTLNDVKEYLVDSGLDKRVLKRIQFKEKSYGFFRSWMDEGIDRGKIIKVIRLMAQSKKWDSRDLDIEDIVKIVGEEHRDFVEGGDMIYFPDIRLDELKRFSGAYIVGGGEHECLSELRLLMDAFNIKYKIMKSLVY